MSDYRQLLLQALAIAVPAFLLVTRREKALLAWICFTLGVEVFNAGVFLIGTEAGRWAGLLLLPKAFGSLRAFRRAAPFRVLVTQAACLVVLGLVFGFLAPWPSDPYPHALSANAPWATVVNLSLLLGDISLSLFVARQVLESGRPDRVVRYILIGTSVSAAFALLGTFSHVDWYSLITGRPVLEGTRLRGLNFEPKSLGNIAAYGLLLTIALRAYQKSAFLILLVLLHLIALLLSTSVGALAALTVAAPVALLSDRRVRVSVFKGLPFAAVLVLASIPAWAGIVERYTESASVKLTRNEFVLEPRNILEAAALRADLTDASALSFFAFNPKYLLTGTGPGLIFLAASPYVPPVPGAAWVGEQGSQLGLPYMGVLLELSNSGVVGVVLWGLFVWTSMRALNRRTKETTQGAPSHWGIARVGFVIGASMYAVQSLYSPIWPVFMGLGIAAATHLRPRPRSGSVRVISPDGGLSS